MLGRRQEDRATERTAPGFLALPSGHASAADKLPGAVDPSTASFRALALHVRAIGLLDRRPGYYRVKITLTISAFFAGWALFVMAGDSWAALAVAPLVGMMFTQLAFIGHDAGHNQVFGTRADPDPWPGRHTEADDLPKSITRRPPGRGRIALTRDLARTGAAGVPSWAPAPPRPTVSLTGAALQGSMARPDALVCPSAERGPLGHEQMAQFSATRDAHPTWLR